MKGDDIAERLVHIAIRIIRIVDELPDTIAGRHVAGQLLRSGTSAGANYEEARGAESKRDFLHKLGISLKEILETLYWLRLVAGAKLIAEPLADIVGEVEELCRILGKSRATAQSRP